MIGAALRRLELGDVPVATPTGRLVGASGLLLESVGCQLSTGQRCQIETAAGGWIDAQVVGFRDKTSFLMPFKSPTGLAAGARVLPISDRAPLMIGTSWLGRMVNGLGEPIDDRGRLGGDHVLEPVPPKVNPLKKRRVEERLDVGVRAINGMLTLGKGQRVGLMAGSGVGKSVLLGLITRQTVVDVVVVGLIGERGREVREFVELSLGEAGLRKAVVVVAPADESPLMRLMATDLCHAIAAHFRDQGKDVLLLVDSLTRYAMARREVALALGEPPATKGYPPSVFSLLPQLVESAGNGEGETGSMSAIYTVLAEGDDQQDPVVDTARAILDGHIVLTRELAERGHYPAIDIAQSISRCMAQVVDKPHLNAARALKEMAARHARVRDLIPLGAYVPGADPVTDRAVELSPRMDAFLRQGTNEAAPMDTCVTHLEDLMA
ncbi:flagellar protein export ATPase FliI [Piscinibacter gummiphilus]|uniref:Flagellum-specific ATP synthase n=1 Tax=Piscinibacter gummiphilus TaxID=946333 RepID=A0A1W6LI67_9BURK|nr:flagellar protein export ATPase FliI [Piscinibacter gummiphilus]ARN23910.1 flagellar protein export ATPase FliI [Piscinibacter gummiphilus]ATU65962.1 flagellum-specific ATP synthase FliI [Piscinibacter gummiphilus]GLS93844.1 flagellum-specific ATP synthase FliI [Piscinibacter gummiphilus]